MLYADRASFLYTREGLTVIRPMMVGGATSMYCGCAAPPPDWFKTEYRIDLDTYVSETIEELELAPLPPALRGEASTRIAEAGGALGYAFQPQLKFMRPSRARHFDCGANCMLGCHCEAKWNAAEFVDEAVAHGAELKTRARVERVLIEDEHAVGVQGTLRGKPFVARAETVIVAAGTPNADGSLNATRILIRAAHVAGTVTAVSGDGATITLQGGKNGKNFADTIPTEGATGWGDTWMLATNAPHPNCAYLWTKWVSTAKVQAEQALSFGETPVNSKACAEMEALQAGSCAQYHADKGQAYFDSIKFWKTPIAQCPDGTTVCVPYDQWVSAWTTIKG